MISAILGIASLGLGLINYFSNMKQETKQERIEAEESLAEIEVSKKETQNKISGYEDFLAKVPVAGQSLTETTGDLEFDEAYRTLMENYGNLNVKAGLTGRVAAGTSAQVVSQQAMQEVEDLVSTETKTAEQQLDVYQTTLSNLEQSEDTYEEVLEANLKKTGGHAI